MLEFQVGLDVMGGSVAALTAGTTAAGAAGAAATAAGVTSVAASAAAPASASAAGVMATVASTWPLNTPVAQMLFRLGVPFGGPAVMLMMMVG